MSDVFGIDLGTTYSAIARINDLGMPEVIQNMEGERTTPSVVYFEPDGTAVIGAEAKKTQIADSENACSLIKRTMGTDYPLEYRGIGFTPESISALILKELVKAANLESSEGVSQVVITIPAYFGVQEREATRQAGLIAGLDVVGIVTEPVAAALSIGSKGEEQETLLVYDLGGGTFDTTVIRWTGPGAVEVVAIDGNRTLGGADWDNALSDFIRDRFVAQSGLGGEDPMLDEDFRTELLGLAEETKKSLTRKQSTTVRLRYRDKDEQVTITRDEFEKTTETLVLQTIEISERVVRTAQAKVAGLTVDRVLLVGGSSRMPMIEAALQDKLGWKPVPSEFDFAVAKGAAVYGQAAVEERLDSGATDEVQMTDSVPQRYLGGSSTLSVTNVLSRGLGVGFVRERGVDDWEDYIDFLAHANETLPLSPPTITAHTIRDNQPVVEIELYEQGGEAESERPGDNTKLRSSTLPIPPLPKGADIEVTLSVTAEGQAKVSAFDPNGGQSIDLEVTISILTQQQIDEAVDVVNKISTRS